MRGLCSKRFAIDLFIQSTLLKLSSDLYFTRNSVQHGCNSHRVCSKTQSFTFLASCERCIVYGNISRVMDDRYCRHSWVMMHRGCIPGSIYQVADVSAIQTVPLVTIKKTFILSTENQEIVFYCFSSDKPNIRENCFPTSYI